MSPPRFAGYVSKAGGDSSVALELYVYNARLAQAFLFPLNVTEVTFRNAVDGVLVKEFGPDWYVDNNFVNTVVTSRSRLTLERAPTRASLSDRDTVVSAIAFDFLSNLLRVEYADIWRTKANVAFPGLERGQGRRKIQQLSKAINILGNRVANDEPILDANVPDLHSKMIRLTRLRCRMTSEWMRHYSTVGSVMRSRPTSKGHRRTGRPARP